ncbi:MAG: hypothetical protein LBP55_07890 [Candidatus Adiutrix sp.]|jgi:hypothetical protein|nr:hypothetical protein [Candidatus Adiutrix sp.]
MQIAAHNYNALGKIGPHYDRPEYRPPEQPPVEENNPRPAPPRGDRRTLSTRNTDAPLKKAARPSSARLSLDTAQTLVYSTAALIRNLPPHRTSQEPHLGLPTGLMTPVYV